MKRKPGIFPVSFLVLMSLSEASPISATTKTYRPSRLRRRMATRKKPVQVYILLGQSNMLGYGKVAGGAEQEGTLEYAVHQKNLYEYLIEDKSGGEEEDDAKMNWATSTRVRNVQVTVSSVILNEFMTISGDTIGPEIGIGHILEEATEGDEDGPPPIMLIKSSVGNRSLGWDLLPPKSKQYTLNGTTVYAGYKESPETWKLGTKPIPLATWYAGKQYDKDIANCKQALSKLGKYYPGATKFQVAGFFWWQGDKDRYDTGHAILYERNLVRLIQQLRQEFSAPKAPFVLATLGQTAKATAYDNNDGLLLDAMLAVDSSTGKYPNLPNVATVYSHPLSKGGSSNNHYLGNAETYMNVGEAMGKAMAKLNYDFATALPQTL